MGTCGLVSRAQASQEFEPTASAARLSRVFVRELLAVWNADELTEVAELVTSELVTNVVRHASTVVAVDVSWDDPTLRVEVRDGSSILPVMRDVPGAHGGYG